ncbi:putative protease [Hathewaya proteolytica DSM 3090]|uniref:Putative protease n=1 Tax=Hathewaya proteolytica DSM 3090 TaxID=1121331 RepID=A0A1M6QSS8_9CLOT|nr:U32 family peptidase [Hathewaya proteolytica]SHK23173.1 putative protease [Hathewaya proteolytica DSM 3090]
MTKGKIELLAPAGSMESLKAAVQSGADAVYLGGNRFSARAYASNFTDETMEEAVEYCHFYGVKVYVTVNTLLKENEVMDAVRYVSFLYHIGVDAVIIQDLGLASLLKANIPQMEIHASTQMTVHNGEGAKFYENYGFKRIVLSRELSLKEIEYISKDLKVETEIFVHGALCVCYSGQCLMSSMIGGRSGNRGRCAQPCRLPYSILNKKTMESKSGYIMSPKDICTIENIGDIIESGASSLKIEGRMKKPEYVAGVVKAYRNAIDKYYLGEEYCEEQDKKILAQLFNREGFSKAYLYGNHGKDMMAVNFPKNMGIYLGTVENDKTVVLREDISVKDGIRFGEEGLVISSIEENKVEVPRAEKGSRVLLKPCRYKIGDRLYKTSDNNLNEALSLYYKEVVRKYPIKLKVKFNCHEAIELSTHIFEHEFTVRGPMVESALKKPLSKDSIEEKLRKCGNTPFEVTEVEFEKFQPGFMAVSAINQVRRDLIDAIMEYRNKESKRESSKGIEGIKVNDTMINHNISSMPEFVATVISEEQLKAVSDFNKENNTCVEICINPFVKNSIISIDSFEKNSIFIRVPSIIKDSEYENCCVIIKRYLPYLKGIITSNMGIASRYSKVTKIILDYKSNIFNSYMGDIFKEFHGVYLSGELNKSEIKSICSNTRATVNMGINLYGRCELMVSEYCPVGAYFGNKDCKSHCSAPCREGEFYLKDRMKVEFPIINDIYCRSYILNGDITNIISFKDEIIKMGIKNFKVDFTFESYDDVKHILQNMLHGKGEICGENYTKGHYKRGVE